MPGSGARSATGSPPTEKQCKSQAWKKKEEKIIRKLFCIYNLLVKGIFCPHFSLKHFKDFGEKQSEHCLVS